MADRLRRAGQGTPAGAKRRGSSGRRRLTLYEFALRVPEPKRPLDFELFPSLRELYTDGVEHPELVVMKATQVGASAWLVRLSIWLADLGKTMLYVFPTEEQLRMFQNARIAPLFRGPYLAKRVRNASVSNASQRQIGDGWLNLRGAQTVAGLESIDADGIAIDEYDLIPPDAIPTAERRISAPTSMGLIRRIGWPSIDDYGIARQYNLSDRRRWFVKCPGCRERQFIRFHSRRASQGDEEGDGLPNATSAYVDCTSGFLRCGKCEKPIAPETMRNGEWVAEFPDRDLRGYHIHRLLAPGISLRRIIEASKKSSPSEKQAFYNRDLGEPYSPKDGRLSRQAIAAAVSAGGNYLQGPWDAGYAGDGLVTMGIDSASARDLHVRISLYTPDLSSKRALFIGAVDSFDTLAQLMQIYNVRMAAIDHLPDGRLARAFAEQFYGRAYYVHFLPQSSSQPWTFDPEERSAAIRRTEAIDETLTLIRAARNHLPTDRPANYVEHLRNVVRFHGRDDLGKETVGYRSLGSIDYLMAEVYDHFAFLLAEGEHIVIAQMSQPEISYVPLEEVVDFERSSLLDLNAPYRPGPDDRPYGDPWWLRDDTDLPYWDEFDEW
jgi:hypothetical protein